MEVLEDPKQAIVWRGPMLNGALQQFVGDVEWGALDYLVLDMPPGTGDVALSMAQSVPMAGAVVVTTPQEVSLSDVRKAVGDGSSPSSPNALRSSGLNAVPLVYMGWVRRRAPL